MLRVDGRQPDQMRAVNITPHYMEYAEGSCLIEVGKTRVICTATIENRVPPHVFGTGRGWVTAEYAMLPRSSQQRIVRDGIRGKVGGRSHEIQRLIGRAIRSVFDLDRFGERTVLIDCDVITADGGTRCASITGALVAVGLAMERLRAEKKLSIQPLKAYLAAVSVGVVEGQPVLDLCYLEDAQAEVDMNVVLTGRREFVEIQGTAETRPFDMATLLELNRLAGEGVGRLVELQHEILGLDLERS
ncbi:MAG TPA: ribonuclease PH [Candidatus Sumerlaeota bacterium]|nr:ribonuclease PH [Candidatus Sumerlaeota bacterium]HOR26719.1 ribonuclease PH [Candidatus Sumerlaeota bacterium]HPK01257.1 ribonuclease PH [Candidatus Sumerlaeota bacterium]